MVINLTLILAVQNVTVICLLLLLNLETPCHRSSFRCLFSIRHSSNEQNTDFFNVAEKRPATPGEFLEVSGVGPAKLERYGEAFLEATTLLA